MKNLTQDEVRALRESMPWSERMVQVGRQCLIQIVNNRGEEVPLLTITAFLRYITPRIAAQATVAAPTPEGAITP